MKLGIRVARLWLREARILIEEGPTDRALRGPTTQPHLWQPWHPARTIDIVAKMSENVRLVVRSEWLAIHTPLE